MSEKPVPLPPPSTRPGSSWTYDPATEAWTEVMPEDANAALDAAAGIAPEAVAKTKPAKGAAT